MNIDPESKYAIQKEVDDFCRENNVSRMSAEADTYERILIEEYYDSVGREEEDYFCETCGSSNLHPIDFNCLDCEARNEELRDA